MSHRIYTPEFKDEAVRQVVERGYTVKEVAHRLGISEASLYTWRKAVVPSKDGEKDVIVRVVPREGVAHRSDDEGVVGDRLVIRDRLRPGSIHVDDAQHRQQQRDTNGVGLRGKFGKLQDLESHFAVVLEVLAR